MDETPEFGGVAQEGKYGRIHTEHLPGTPFGPGEPVFLLRAQDQAAMGTLAAYYGLCSNLGATQAHLDSIVRAQGAFSAWQAQHATKVPD